MIYPRPTPERIALISASRRRKIEERRAARRAAVLDALRPKHKETP